MLRINYIFWIILSFLMVFTGSGLYAQWQTSQPRYSYEDYRDLRVSIEEREKVQTYEKSESKSCIKKIRNNDYTGEKKSVRKKKSSSVIKKNSTQQAAKKYKRYTVKKGDTLYKIARKYSVNYSDICRANSLKDKDVLYAGMVLKIPTRNKSNGSSSENHGKSPENNPHFNWPMKKVLSYKRDGSKGVRSIGIIIKSRSNEPVYPAASGVVKKVGEMRGFGKYIVVTHRDRYITVYSNLKNISVSAGDRVKENSYLGNISDNDILHFQIDHAGKPRNPLDYLPKKG